MDSFFLACFVFGALFTVVSFALGFAGAHLPHIGNHFDLPDFEGGHPTVGVGHLGHAGHLGGAGHGAHAPALDGHAHAGGPHAAHAHADGAQANEAAHGLPLFNASTLLAFVTWFGAAGYVLTRTLDAPAIVVTPIAVVIGAVGGYLVALFLARVLAGERVMDPYDYRLAGTLGRVSVSIPPAGVGEVLFSKAGRRRSEAARGVAGRAIPRNTEVIITDYAQGIATVEPWAEALARPGMEAEPVAERAKLPPRANA